MTDRFDIMIDLETLDTTPRSKVLSIAAQQFDEGGPIGECMYLRPHLSVQDRWGRTTSETTMMFWWGQPASVRDEQLSPLDRVPVRTCLAELANYCAGARFVWAKSPSFDLVILEDLARDAEVQLPRWYQKQRDLRTLLALVGLPSDWAPPKPPEGRDWRPHDPVDDCAWQIAEVLACYEALGEELF